MKKSGLATAALLAVTLAASAAQAADVTLTRTPTGGLDLTAQITTPNGCYFSKDAKLGPPDDFPEVKNAVVITLDVGANGDICPQEITVLDYHLTLPGIPKDTVAVIVYERWPQARTIKATAYPVPARKK